MDIKLCDMCGKNRADTSYRVTKNMKSIDICDECHNKLFGTHYGVPPKGGSSSETRFHGLRIRAAELKNQGLQVEEIAERLDIPKMIAMAMVEGAENVQV